MFLATTANEYFWDKSQEILFLGEWCKIYNRKEEISNFEHKTLEFIWSNPNELYNAWEYSEEVYQKVLSILVPFLNEFHRVEYDTRYWDIILKPWLSIYIQTLYDKYRHIKLAYDKYDVNTLILSEDSYQYINLPTTFTKNIMNNDTFNLQIYSQIIDFLKYKSERKEHLSNIFDHKIEFASTFWRKKVKKISKKLHEKYRYSKSLMIVNPYFKFNFWKNLKQLALKTKMRYFFDDLIYDIKIDENFNKKMRKSLFTSSKFGDEFLDLLFKTFEYNFPLIYLEGYNSFNKEIDSLNIKVPTAVYTVNSLLSNEIFKFFTAKNYKKIKFLYGQHGGVIGINQNMNAESIERNFADIYYTYGWRESSKTIPLSIPLYRQKNIDMNNRVKINFIMNSMPRYLCGFSFTADSSNMIKYIDTVKKFFISSNITDKITIRPYMFDYGWEMKDRLVEINKNLCFDDSTNYYEQIFNAKLNIFDHMYTGYMESLSLNIPTIIIIDKSTYHFRESFFPMLERLNNAKILFFCPMEAAEFIDENLDNINNWWKSKNLQTIRRDFCSNYSRTSSDWMSEWIDAFDKEL